MSSRQADLSLTTSCIYYYKFACFILCKIAVTIIVCLPIFCWCKFVYQIQIIKSQRKINRAILTQNECSSLHHVIKEKIFFKFQDVPQYVINLSYF